MGESEQQRRSGLGGGGGGGGGRRTSDDDDDDAAAVAASRRDDNDLAAPLLVDADAAGGGDADSGRPTTSSSNDSSSEASSGEEMEAALAPGGPPPVTIPFWKALLPGTLYCFQLFGFQPILSQRVNQLECDRLGASDCNSSEVNAAAVLEMKYILALEFACATLTLGTVGAICDYRGRKPAMIITTVGQIVNLVAMLLALNAPYHAARALIFVGTALVGLSGSYGTYLTGIYAYAADLTKRDPESRGRVFGKILGAIAIGNTTGPLISGLVLRAAGYAAPLLMQLACCVVIVLQLAFWVQESQDPRDRPREPFDPLRTHNTFVVLYQFLVTYRHESRRAGGGAGRSAIPPLLPLSIVFCLCFSDLVGQGTMFIYYAKRVFRWRADMLGYFESFVGLSKGVVMLGLLPLVYRYWLKGRPPNDYLFAAVGMAFGMVFFLMLALLPYPAAAFAAIPFAGLNQATYPHLRSLFSVSVSQDSQGQLFSAMSAMETLMTAVTPLITNSIYGSTVDSYPGLVWLVLFGYLVFAELALYWAWGLAKIEREGGKARRAQRGPLLSLEEKEEEEEEASLSAAAAGGGDRVGPGGKTRVGGDEEKGLAAPLAVADGK